MAFIPMLFQIIFVINVLQVVKLARIHPYQAVKPASKLELFIDKNSLFYKLLFYFGLIIFFLFAK
jgi:hypothetical protein